MALLTAAFWTDAVFGVEFHGAREARLFVDNDPAREFEGIDDQLNKAIEVILEQMKSYPDIPEIPAWPDKTK